MRALDSWILKIFAHLFVFVPSCVGMISRHQSLVRISQSVWRQAARRHQDRIHELLAPGLTPLDHPLNMGMKRDRRRHPGRENDWVTALDPKHPIYNFLIEYYGLKTAKGPRRLARWSPSPGLLLQDETSEIESLEQLDELSNSYLKDTRPTSRKLGVLLDGVMDEDFGNTLHLRGTSIIENGSIIYSPSLFFDKGDVSKVDEQCRQSAAFLWYQSVLKQTLSSEPIFHCYGLHGEFGLRVE